MKAINRVERDNLKTIETNFSVGDTVRVSVTVREGDKTRVQIFEGTVIGRRGGGVRETFTVRKISGSNAVERIFPLHAPSIEKIELVRRGRVRRAQLTYMRDRIGKRARIVGLRADSKLAQEERAMSRKGRGRAAATSLDTSAETPDKEPVESKE
jgi:large subunit ribosomal protein L19